MISLNILTKKVAANLVSLRQGETKFFEKAYFLETTENLLKQLVNSPAKFVLFGIKEDIGVRANLGKPGSKNTWDYVLKSILNTQHNDFNNGSNLLILGALEFPEIYEELNKKDFSNPSTLNYFRKAVEFIDTQVTQLIFQIVESGKIPIIIGGGHNNAYGNIKGYSSGLKSKINVINLDAHADFRELEGRHSGNGFSYAFEEGFLDRYYILGLHENYNSQYIWDKIKSVNSRVKFSTFDAMKVREETNFKDECLKALDFISEKPFGIEIDCDAIEDLYSSAMTPSGFSVSEARAFINMFAMHQNSLYMHLCEAGVTDGVDKSNDQQGKLLAYFVTDFLKAKSKKGLTIA